MARKFTTIEFEGDRQEIQRIIETYYGERVLFQYYYVRDDRYIDIYNNTVYVGSEGLPASKTRTVSLGSHQSICGDLLTNAVFDENGGTLFGKMVFLEACEKQGNGVFKIKLVDNVIFDFINGSCCTKFKSDDWITDLSKIGGIEWFSKDLKEISEYFPEQKDCERLYELWHFIQKYNIRHLVSNYSKLIDNVQQYHKFSILEDRDDFFEALSIHPDFVFSLSDEYWNDYCTYTQKGVFLTAHTTSELSNFYSKLESEHAKKAIISSAENKYFALKDLGNGLSPEDWTILAHYVNTYPEFFIDYITNPFMLENDEVLQTFNRYCQCMVKANQNPSIENLLRIRIDDSLKSKNLDRIGYERIQKSLDTKEGIIDCFEKFAL